MNQSLPTIIELNDINEGANSTTPPGVPSDGGCNIIDGHYICVDPLNSESNNKKFLVNENREIESSYAILNTASCTSEQQAPEGKPENFDINKHLKEFENGGKALMDLPLVRHAARAAVMASMFALGRMYDLKANPDYMS